MIIRSFEERDEPAVTALWRAVFPADRPWHDPAEDIRRKRAFQRELFFVAELDSVVVGTVLGGYDGHRGWVYHLAVSPAHRRRGIGSALLGHVEEALRRVGCPKLNLQILAANSGVVAFYERLGYRVEERISMGKPLGPQA
jgi:ribosomal protein S18 acetylase RimI-like enzyme